MVDTSIFKEQTEKAKLENMKALSALLEQKAYVDVEIDGVVFKVRRLGIQELKLIEKIKEDTSPEEMMEVIRTILSKMLLIDNLEELDDGIVLYLFMKIVSELAKQLNSEAENFQH